MERQRCGARSQGGALCPLALSPGCEASTLEDAGYDPATFDAVVMLHVIEHLDDPAGTLETIAHVLRPRGFLVVETPVYDTLMYGVLGRRERSLSCDGHIVFYTGRTLAALLERCGLKLSRNGAWAATVSLGRLLWNIGVMSKSKTVQQVMIERLSAAWDLMHRGRPLSEHAGHGSYFRAQGAMTSVVDTYELSPMQAGMLFHGLSGADANAYIEQVVATLHEPLDEAQFLRAWQRVAERHPVLRSRFRLGRRRATRAGGGRASPDSRRAARLARRRGD